MENKYYFFEYCHSDVSQSDKDEIHVTVFKKIPIIAIDLKIKLSMMVIIVIGLHDFNSQTKTSVA